MNNTAVAIALVTLLANPSTAAEPLPGVEASEAEVEITVTADQDGPAVKTPSADTANFCFFSGSPPAENQYTVVRKLKLGKGTYGSVTDILPRFAERAQQTGADAIINYTGSQRFGVLPWRIVRPVVRGVAIKWAGTQKPDCVAAGGTTLATILTTNLPPHQ